MGELLRMENISKVFGTFYANKDVNLTINEGEVHTLLGENGAGKSTLMNVLIGLYQPTEGRIFLRGREVKINSPLQSVNLGIGMVHQHFMLVEAMTVLENIILGDRKDKGLFIDRQAREKEIVELAEKYKFNVQLDKVITELSVGEQQRVEILKALYRGADLLILDEPSAALTDIEVEGLFEMIEMLKSEGKSIIFISHKMREVLRVSDRITVLRRGEVVDTVDAKGCDGQMLANLMIGQKLENTNYKKVKSEEEPVINFNHVSYNKESKHSGLNDVSVTIRKGEVLGIAGVDGNGQTQLAQLITGNLIPDEGEVDFKGNKVVHFNPSVFIKNNTAHIPEDRNLQGLVGDMSVAENIVLKDTDKTRFSKLSGFWLKKNEIRKYAEEMKDKYDIRLNSIDQTARSLSGGNQQKIILARELESDPDLLVAVHPSRGLDIGATRFVRNQMMDARDRGCAVLLISADFDEILELSDRILVLFEGSIMGEYDGSNPPVDEISLAMTGK